MAHAPVDCLISESRAGLAPWSHPISQRRETRGDHTLGGERGLGVSLGNAQDPCLASRGAGSPQGSSKECPDVQATLPHPHLRSNVGASVDAKGPEALNSGRASLFSRPGSCQRVRRCVCAWTVGESQGIVAASAAVGPASVAQESSWKVVVDAGPLCLPARPWPSQCLEAPGRMALGSESEAITARP